MFNRTSNPIPNLETSNGFSYNDNKYYKIKNNNNFFRNDLDKKERPERTSIIGIGDCIVDILTEINNEIIDKYHLESDKTKYTDENTQNIFEVLERMPTVTYIPGGSIQNSLRVLSFCLNNNFSKNNNVNNIGTKYNLSMLGCTGDDNYRDKIFNTLNQSRINPLIQIIKGETSRCGAGIYNKKPFFISEIKASKLLDKEFIISNKEHILNHEILLIEGYYLQYQFEFCEALCDLFQKEQNKIIILTLSPISLNQYLYEKFIKIANYADIIFSSKAQAEDFTCLKGGIENQKIFEKIFQNLTNNKQRLLVIKDGKDVSYCSKYDYKEKHLEFILTCYAQQIRNEEIVDEIGLEDAFLGGFLSEYMKGNNLYLCLKRGNDMANLILKNPGCTFERKKQ